MTRRLRAGSYSKENRFCGVIFLLDPQIATNLKEYKKHKQGICLECGYEGLMGLGAPILRAYIRIPLKIILFVLGLIAYALLKKSIWALIVIVIILSPIMIKLDKHCVYCPNCQKILK